MCSGWQVPTTNAGSQQKPLLLPEQKTPLWFIKCICQLASARRWESQTCCRRPRTGRGLTSVTVSERLGVHCLDSAGKLDPIPTRVQLNQVSWLHLESCHTPSVSHGQDLWGVIPLHLQDLSPDWPVLHCHFYDTVIIVNSTLIQKTSPCVRWCSTIFQNPEFSKLAVTLGKSVRHAHMAPPQTSAGQTRKINFFIPYHVDQISMKILKDNWRKCFNL